MKNRKQTNKKQSTNDMENNSNIAKQTQTTNQNKQQLRNTA